MEKNNRKPEYFVRDIQISFHEFFQKYWFKSESVKNNNMIKVSNYSIMMEDLDELKIIWESTSSPQLKFLKSGFDYDASEPHFALLSIYNELTDEVVYMVRVPVLFPSDNRSKLGLLGALTLGSLVGYAQAKKDSSLGKGIFYGLSYGIIHYKFFY